MIETLGVPALIAAADAAAKTADVQVTAYEKADAGIVTVYIWGDVSSVKAAVEAGEAEARKVGQLLSAHVIARPDVTVATMLERLRSDEKKTEGDGLEPVALDVETLTKLSVQELRELAKNTPGFPLAGREISAANKADLIRLLTELKE
ncbi:BMC domain-containing protein [Paenibacillus sp. RC67]|uniref:BMC domain-containing protein n=1 Tax=Paenibacillus sp. RC67 TaxID=3039392 RepID=UPI0024AE5143|nr:BMC domain-containing protein [Paenibacillus sp. RC67]